MEAKEKETEAENVSEDTPLQESFPLPDRSQEGLRTITGPLDTGITYPFKRWVDSLRSKRRIVPHISEVYVDGWFDDCSTVLNETGLGASLPPQEQQWDRMSGGSSSILGTVKTASMSLATQSATRSRGDTYSSHQSVSNSDPLPGFDMRRSLDSTRLSISQSMENAVRNRAVKRRYALYEILDTELNYVQGLQMLCQVVSTYLTTRPTILRVLQRVLQLHETFKKRLQSVTPLSVDCPPADVPVHLELRTPPKNPSRLGRSQSQSLRTRNFKSTIDTRRKKAIAEPSEALRVAQEVEKLSEGFSAYEDFCNQYDLLEGDLGHLRRLIPANGFWAEGIEALARSVDSIDNRKRENKKAMTLDDLLAKPIQRLCKYHVLLEQLLKMTPASDCPSTHYEIYLIWDKVRRLVGQINTSASNPTFKSRIQKTFLLQERLEYSGQGVLRDVYQQLGPLNLCGVLYVTYKSTDHITGEFMVCILFPSYLVLARAGYDHRKLTVVASLYVLDMTVDVLTNGQGLVCCDTLYSWKINFQDPQSRYELILSASSAMEEKQWKTELLRASAMPPIDLPTLSLEPRKFYFLFLPLVPLGCIGSASTVLARRPSTRSMSMRPCANRNLEQVIIKKTHNTNHDEHARHLHHIDIERSRSVARETTPTILAPFRQDRVKLEKSIADIYTSDVLPYPGMTLTGADYFRTHSLMRGLSFRTPFNSRRSTSISKITIKSNESGSDTKDDELHEKDMEVSYPLQDVVPLTQSSTDSGSPEVAPETIRHAAPKAFQSVRQHMVRASSDFITYKTNETKPRTKRRPTPWKRWTSPMAFLGVLTPSRSDSAQSSDE